MMKPKRDESKSLDELLHTPAAPETMFVAVDADGEEPEKQKRKPKSRRVSSKWPMVFATIIVLAVAGILFAPYAQPPRSRFPIALYDYPPWPTPTPTRTPVPFAPTATPIFMTFNIGSALDEAGFPPATGQTPIVTSTGLDENGCALHPTAVFAPNDTIYLVVKSSLKMRQTLQVEWYADDRITLLLKSPLAGIDQDYGNVCVSFRYQPVRPLQPGVYLTNVFIDGGYFIGGPAFTVQ